MNRIALATKGVRPKAPAGPPAKPAAAPPALLDPAGGWRAPGMPSGLAPLPALRAPVTVRALHDVPGLVPGPVRRPQAALALPRIVHGMEDLGDAVPALVARAQAIRDGASPRGTQGKSAVLVFEKPSTRTRVSLELGLQRMGMHVSCIDVAGSQLSRGESPADTGLVLGRYADVIVVRAAADARFHAMAGAAEVPVLNALTAAEHPCQVLADWTALAITWGRLEGRVLAYVGDGNNMCHSYLLGAPLMGLDLRVATPPGHAPDPRVVARARALAARAGTRLHIGTDPRHAVAGAHAVATDTWTSMGHDAERDARLAAFAGYSVDEALMARAAPGALFLHCLPGHWGEEAAEDVAHGPHSLIALQAECRMWAQMALVEALLARGPPAPPARGTGPG